MIEISKACQPESPGLHMPLFTKTELDRAEAIATALDGLDIYSAQQLLNKMMTYLLLTTFRSATD